VSLGPLLCAPGVLNSAQTVRLKERSNFFLEEEPVARIADEEIERLKGEVDLAELVTRSGALRVRLA